MGVKRKPSDTTSIPPMPDPENWKMLKAERIGKYLIVQIQYPSCTNYEGVKILVFKNTTADALIAQHRIDPHFTEDKTYKSPVARFMPTEEGWDMAKIFCHCLTEITA